jgi:hypothetical protein
MEQDAPYLRAVDGETLRIAKAQQILLKEAYGEQLLVDPSRVRSRRDVAQLRKALLGIERAAAIAQAQCHAACGDAYHDWLAAGWCKVAEGMQRALDAEAIDRDEQEN